MDRFEVSSGGLEVVVSIDKGTNTLTIGDIHFSDAYTGKHKDYFTNCVEVINMITDAMVEHKVNILLLLGDLIGQREKNLVHRETILYFMKVLKKWNDMTDGNVYSLRGNHDMGRNMTDFEMFVSLGLVKVVNQLDIGNVRYHFMHFGEETRAINFDSTKYNIALTHNDIQVEGQTTWWHTNGGIALSSLRNLKGVSLVIGGHIHNPSPKMVTTNIDGEDVSLYYPGNATRPKTDNRWNTCFGIITSERDGDVALSQVTFNLTPYTEIFSSTFDDVDEVDEVVGSAPTIDIEELSRILEELQSFNVGGVGDYRSQVTRFAGIDKDAADLAIRYIEEEELVIRDDN